LFLTALSSAVLSERLDQFGAWLGFSAGLSAFVTALVTDPPEIASAVTDQVGGRHDLGIRVIFGSTSSTWRPCWVSAFADSPSYAAS
jgi:Ca2+/H+ antiporter